MALGLLAWLLITPNDAGSCMLSVGSLNTTWLKAFKKSAEKKRQPYPSPVCAWPRRGRNSSKGNRAERRGRIECLC
jgi:hypothetical protein